MGVASALLNRAAAAAQVIRDAPRVSVVHHIDADGVSSGAIAIEALDRAGIPHDAIPVRSMDDASVLHVKERAADVLWFCDLGSTVHMQFEQRKVVCDHHELVRDGTEEFDGHVNPLLDDLPGTDVSGAGAAYLVAEALDERNRDLRPLALVGAAADLQDRETGQFAGSNQAILAAAVEDGQVDVRHDLAFYGPATRPLRNYLAYTDDRPVPGITGNRRGAEKLLLDLDIPLQQNGAERTWESLEEMERVAIRSAIVNRRLDCGLPVDDLWRHVVTLTTEAPHHPTRELQEFGTLLNSTARYDRPDVGVAVARGDREAAFQEALELRSGHSKHLVGALDAMSRAGITETPSLQWVHLEDQVRDTVVGIVCGMALDGLGLRTDKPLLGFAHTPDGRTKVSSRAPKALQGRVDLATAMRTGAEAVDGQGGGHKGAAGATIPRGSEGAFLDVVDGVVAQQLR